MSFNPILTKTNEDPHIKETMRLSTIAKGRDDLSMVSLLKNYPFSKTAPKE